MRFDKTAEKALSAVQYPSDNLPPEVRQREYEEVRA